MPRRLFALLALGLAWTPAARADGSCDVFLRDSFDRLGQLAISSGLTEAQLQSAEELTQARPRRCEPGSYGVFAGRYADLLLVLSTRWSDNALRLASLARVLAPRRVPDMDYDAAFHSFLDARSRLASHLTIHGEQILGLFDAIRPEPLVSPGAPTDREGVLRRIYEVRRLIALGELTQADSRLTELIAALQNAPSAAPHAGVLVPGDAGSLSSEEIAPADAGTPKDGGPNASGH